MLHATDFADRLNNVIIPALKEGRVVLADRYIFTALARDVARACERKWVRNLYSFAVKPDRTFYFKVPVEMSLDRILVTRTPNYYEAGMDMNLSSNLYENYLKFQGLVITEYDSMVEEFNFEVIDGTLPYPSTKIISRQDYPHNSKEIWMKKNPIQESLSLPRDWMAVESLCVSTSSKIGWRSRVMPLRSINENNRSGCTNDQ